MDPFFTSSAHFPMHHSPAHNRAEQQVKEGVGTGRSVIAKPIGSNLPQGQPDDKKRQVSLSDGMHHLTLTERPASLCAPVTERPVAAQPGPSVHSTPERDALKKALYKLSCDNLSPPDFIVLVNRFGYHPPLYSFALDTLQPVHWLALTEWACRQLLRRDPSLFTQLPAQIMTCDLCIETYRNHGQAMFKWLPDRLKESFFTKLVEKSPLAVLNLPACEQTCDRLLAA